MQQDITRAEKSIDGARAGLGKLQKQLEFSVLDRNYAKSNLDFEETA